MKLHEGLRLRAYQDSEGIWTIGYGRNLQILEISEPTAEKWLREDLQRAADRLYAWPTFSKISSLVRREVLIEMCYNLGYAGLYGFKRMWAAIREENWDLAAVEMLDSKWSRQVGRRAVVLANRMRTGSYVAV